MAEFKEKSAWRQQNTDSVHEKSDSLMGTLPAWNIRIADAFAEIDFSNEQNLP